MYFIFDMDETIAQLYSVYHSLHYRDFINLKNKPYKKFVAAIVKQEISDTPLGILRPGILDIMTRLYKLQLSKKIKGVIIYSNNTYLESLEFIRDIIHTHIGTNQLIKECIHWDHYMRKEETRNVHNKTWNVLRNIIAKGKYKDPNVHPKDVYFFDDLDHPDLKMNIVYYKVPPYTFKASFDRIAAIYKEALHKVSDSEDISDSNKVYNKLPPLPDSGIDMMLDAIKKCQRKKTKTLKNKHKVV